MKPARLPAAALLLALCLSGCISFRIIPSFPLEGHVERIVFCADVDERGDLLEPKEERETFQGSQKSVICFIEIKNISRKIGMRWKWYGPGRSLLRDSGNVFINREERLLEVVTAYDEILLDIREKEEKVGRWTVVVLINDQLVSRRTFDVH